VRKVNFLGLLKSQNFNKLKKGRWCRLFLQSLPPNPHWACDLLKAWGDINPMTAATCTGVKRFRVLNTTINIKDMLWRRLENYKIWRIYTSAAVKGLIDWWWCAGRFVRARPYDKIVKMAPSKMISSRDEVSAPLTKFNKHATWNRSSRSQSTHRNSS
jgi:hypothetical protein